MHAMRAADAEMYRFKAKTKASAATTLAGAGAK